MPDPALCTEATNPNYTIGTFALYIHPSGGTESLLGNIQTGGFQFTPNIVEHRRGIDNSLDAMVKIGSDYKINFTADEITAANIAVMLNENYVTVAEGCQVPFTGERCVIEYGVRLFHQFPCQEKSLTITFWRATILADFTLNFDQTGWAAFAGTVQSLYCGSTHPTAPFGQAVWTEPCPSS